MSDDPNPKAPKASILPSAVAERLVRARARLGALSRPAKVLLIGTLLVATALGVWRATAGSRVEYGVLYSDLEGEDAGAVVAKLKERGVAYRLALGGSTVEVPAAEVAEARLALAAEGLPRSGQVGFESFDKLRLGATEFEQQVTYRRAMEGELARTVGTVKAVRSARVHLVLPKRSAFAARDEPASAAIVVRLRAGRELGPSEITGIVNLVAAAVPGLEPGRVALVTTEGVVLQRAKRSPNGEAGTEGPADDEITDRLRARAEEAALEDRTRSMLERVVGAGRVEVRVRAELDHAKVESRSDHFDPATTALRSEQLTIERARGDSDDGAAGVPGAESNLPSEDPEPAGAAAAGGLLLRRSHTRNFEVTRVEERRVSVTDTVKRLAVAVVVDGTFVGAGADAVFVPRDPEELDKLATLVRSAVGFDALRGDVVTVESLPFAEALPVDADDPTGVPDPEVAPAPELAGYLPFAAAGAGLLVAVALGALLWRRRRRRRNNVLAVIEAPLPTPVDEVIARIDYRAEASARAKSDPATAALVMRHWLGTTNQLPARQAEETAA
ncbi:MAG: flagellar M-ring protein FliF [Myxococcales bacterium]|nr:flagellar M-ring protein FliF [Myxococcales bacterium]